MTRQRLAIVGSGIAGLGCARFLNQDFDITIFEKRNRIGGHVNSVTVEEDGNPVSIDTGFMVYNHTTYPNFTRLIKELKVKIQPTDMSFSVQHEPVNIEWSGTGFKRLFARRANLLSGMFWTLLFAIDKFNKKAKEFLDSSSEENITIAQFVERAGVKPLALDLYILPMMSSLWSAPPQAMREFPVTLFLKFMHSHGLLSIYDKLDWYTITGGANNYVNELIKPFESKIRLDSGVKAVTENESGVSLITENDEKLDFDKCIFACHANQAMNMLSEENQKERKVLSGFAYQKNTATLHTDTSVMPEQKGNWASWNYRIRKEGDGMRSSTHYWMNSLQNVSQKENYFVTIDSPDTLEQTKIIKEIEYEHPIFSLSSFDSQKKIALLNKDSKDRKLFFAGSYFRYGFHEDAFQSSVDLSTHLLGRPAWN